MVHPSLSVTEIPPGKSFDLTGLDPPPADSPSADPVPCEHIQRTHNRTSGQYICRSVPQSISSHPSSALKRPKSSAAPALHGSEECRVDCLVELALSAFDPNEIVLPSVHIQKIKAAARATDRPKLKVLRTCSGSGKLLLKVRTGIHMPFNDRLHSSHLHNRALCADTLPAASARTDQAHADDC